MLETGRLRSHLTCHVARSVHPTGNPNLEQMGNSSRSQCWLPLLAELGSILLLTTVTDALMAGTRPASPICTTCQASVGDWT